jgi:hypothetical protein
MDNAIEIIDEDDDHDSAILPYSFMNRARSREALSLLNRMAFSIDT